MKTKKESNNNEFKSWPKKNKKHEWHVIKIRSEGGVSYPLEFLKVPSHNIRLGSIIGPCHNCPNLMLYHKKGKWWEKAPYWYFTMKLIPIKKAAKSGIKLKYNKSIIPQKPIFYDPCLLVSFQSQISNFLLPRKTSPFLLVNEITRITIR